MENFKDFKRWALENEVLLKERHIEGLFIEHCWREYSNQVILEDQSKGFDAGTGYTRLVENSHAIQR